MFTSCLIFVKIEMSARCYLGNKQSDRNFGCTDFTTSIIENMDILGLMKNRRYISALNQQINLV